MLASLYFVRCYIDDILIFSKDGKKHQKHIIMILEHLVEHGLKLHSSKCTFFHSHIEYLGHMIYP